MKKIKINLLIILFACITNAAEFTVSIDGKSEYDSIQKAIDEAPERSIIHIASGLYQENLEINKSLKLIGAGWDKTVIFPKTTGISTEDLNGLIESAESGEQRKSIEAKLKDKYFRPMLVVSDAENVEISGLKITALDGQGEFASFASAIADFNNSEVTLNNCMVIGGPKNGIDIRGESNCKIQDCFVAAVWSTGIVIGQRDNKKSAVEIVDCDVRNCHYAGIVIRTSNNLMIKSCRVSGAAWHGIRYDDASPEIVGNIIFGNARCGIYASGKTKAVVKNNLFYKNEMGGIACWQQNNDIIRNNTFACNLREAMSMADELCEPFVENNIFFDNPCAIVMYKGANPKFRNNFFWQNEACVLANFKKDDLQEMLSEKILITEEANSVTADPQFQDASGKDFSLSKDSPALLRGVGVANHIVFESPWPLQPEEIAIIPASQTRNSRMWKKPGQKMPEFKQKLSTPVNDEATRKAEQKKRRIEELLDEKYRLEMYLAEQKQMMALPDATEKLEEYKRKRAELKKSESEQISSEVGKQRQQQWEQFNKLHGDKSKDAYLEIRSAVSNIIVYDVIDSEMEPFLKATTVGWKESREQLSKSLGVDIHTNPNELWFVYKTFLKDNNNVRQKQLEKIIEQYSAPEVVVEHARQDSKKEYYSYCYQYLIDLFSQEKMQETQKKLGKLKAELSK